MFRLPLHSPQTIVPRSPQTPREGVTLLEVIVSMGVLVVGLMGMASLIPLGRLEMAEGDRLDNSSTLGRGAFRDLSVRGHVNPQMWVNPLSGTAVATSTGYIYATSSAAELPPFAPIVIDPLMCAPRFQLEDVNGALKPAEEEHRKIVQNFPYSVNLTGAEDGWPEKTMPRLARATLRSYPIDAARRAGNTPAMTMRFDLASRLFRSNDDIVIDAPLDRVRKPVQEFALSELTNLSLTATDGVIAENRQTQVAYRKFRGDYSWFFIVQPNPAERISPDAMMPSGAGFKLPGGSGFAASPFTTTSFRVWVIICNKRDYRDTAGMNLGADRAVGERCVWIDFIDRYTARLRVLDVPDEGTALKILDVKSNQWIAAAAKSPNALLGGDETVLEWFRILNTSDRPTQVPGTNIWYREVALSGRDVSPLTAPDESSIGLQIRDADEYEYPDLGAETLTAWGVFIPGIRGVYEKSIYADRPSLWSPQ